MACGRALKVSAALAHLLTRLDVEGDVAAAARAVGLRHRRNVADRRYSTARWQRLRKAVLYRDGRVCRIQGPRCTGHATTVHHIEPSSQRPDLFWASENLVSACSRCNYGGGRRVAADNGRRRIEQLQEIILEQDQRIQHLLERLQQYEPQHPETPLRRDHPRPAIY